MDAATLKLRVSPGARRPGFGGRHGDAWKLRVAAPPEDGRANDAVVTMLSDALGVPRAAVELVSGHASRDKLVVLRGLAQADAEARLAAAAGESVSSDRRREREGR
ncbi:MAG: DUF167 domain-containing protein [Gaiellaceae bacterium]